MTDVHDPVTRSYNMAAIKGKDTGPEIWLRKALFRKGFRYRLHRRELPGTPDIVLPGRHVVIFIHGCFWHGHKNCPMFRLPATRREFWQKKIADNRKRDKQNRSALRKTGWRVLEVWECALKGKNRYKPEDLIHQVSAWILSTSEYAVIEGYRADIS